MALQFASTLAPNALRPVELPNPLDRTAALMNAAGFIQKTNQADLDMQQQRQQMKAQDEAHAKAAKVIEIMQKYGGDFSKAASELSTVDPEVFGIQASTFAQQAETIRQNRERQAAADAHQSDVDAFNILKGSPGPVSQVIAQGPVLPGQAPPTVQTIGQHPTMTIRSGVPGGQSIQARPISKEEQDAADVQKRLAERQPPVADQLSSEFRMVSGMGTNPVEVFTVRDPNNPMGVGRSFVRGESGLVDVTGRTSPYQPPKSPSEGAFDNRMDRSYQYNSTALDQVEKPIIETSLRIGRLNDTIASGTPQADALVAPELLTVMAGGQGSGLRMTEAEIARIIGGRSKWETLKASIQKWSLDPESANSITADQRQQIRSLLKTVNDKLLIKREIIDDARNSMIDAVSVDAHRRILSTTKSRITAVDTGDAGDTGGRGGGKIRFRSSDGQILEVDAARWADVLKRDPKAQRIN